MSPLIINTFTPNFVSYYFFSCSVKVASKNNSSVEQELYTLAQRASECLDRLYPSGKLAEVRFNFFLIHVLYFYYM